MRVFRVEKRRLVTTGSGLRALLAAALFVQPLVATAYVGPGAGLGVIGTLIALLSAVFLLIVGFVWYPIKRLLKRKKHAKKSPENTDSQGVDKTEKQRDSNE